MAEYTKTEKAESFARVLMAVGVAPTIPMLDDDSMKQGGWYKNVVSLMPEAAGYDETVYAAWERCVSNTRTGGMSWRNWAREFYIWQGASARVFYSINGEMTMERFEVDEQCNTKYFATQ